MRAATEHKTHLSHFDFYIIRTSTHAATEFLTRNFMRVRNATHSSVCQSQGGNQLINESKQNRFQSTKWNYICNAYTRHYSNETWNELRHLCVVNRTSNFRIPFQSTHWVISIPIEIVGKNCSLSRLKSQMQTSLSVSAEEFSFSTA